MRVNLSTQPARHFPTRTDANPLKLTIRPACGIPGNYECETDSWTLLRLLWRETDLPASVIEKFERELRVPREARLLAVELSEVILTKIGYFID
jgi:hypothetical protein